MNASNVTETQPDGNAIGYCFLQIAIFLLLFTALWLTTSACYRFARSGRDLRDAPGGGAVAVAMCSFLLLHVTVHQLLFAAGIALPQVVTSLADSLVMCSDLNRVAATALLVVSVQHRELESRRRELRLLIPAAVIGMLGLPPALRFAGVDRRVSVALEAGADVVATIPTVVLRWRSGDESLLSVDVVGFYAFATAHLFAALFCHDRVVALLVTDARLLAYACVSVIAADPEPGAVFGGAWRFPTPLPADQEAEVIVESCEKLPPSSVRPSNFLSVLDRIRLNYVIKDT